MIYFGNSQIVTRIYVCYIVIHIEDCQQESSAHSVKFVLQQHSFHVCAYSTLFMTFP